MRTRELYTTANTPQGEAPLRVPDSSPTPKVTEVHLPSGGPRQGGVTEEEEEEEEKRGKAEVTVASVTTRGDPVRIKIFEGGYKSNEDYVYIRGRGRGKYVCEECGVRCKKPSMLRKHIHSHSDARPFVCDHCNFAFKTKGNLTKHMKSKAHGKKCQELGVLVELEAEEGASEDPLQDAEGRPGLQVSDLEDSDVEPDAEEEEEEAEEEEEEEEGEEEEEEEEEEEPSALLPELAHSHPPAGSPPRPTPPCQAVLSPRGGSSEAAAAHGHPGARRPGPTSESPTSACCDSTPCHPARRTPDQPDPPDRPTLPQRLATKNHPSPRCEAQPGETSAGCPLPRLQTLLLPRSPASPGPLPPYPLPLQGGLCPQQPPGPGGAGFLGPGATVRAPGCVERWSALPLPTPLPHWHLGRTPGTCWLRPPPPLPKPEPRSPPRTPDPPTSVTPDPAAAFHDPPAAPHDLPASLHDLPAALRGPPSVYSHLPRHSWPPLAPVAHGLRGLLPQALRTSGRAEDGAGPCPAPLAAQAPLPAPAVGGEGPRGPRSPYPPAPRTVAPAPSGAAPPSEAGDPVRGAGYRGPEET